jgi:hypothetical protein
MRTLLNGRELDGLDPGLERRLAGGVSNRPVEGVALSDQGSIAARAGQLRLILGAATAFVILSLALNVGIVAARAPQAMALVWLIASIALGVTLALVFGLYVLMLGAHRRRVEARPDTGLAPQTVVRVDAAGLTVAGLVVPWVALTADELWVRERLENRRRVTYVERLGLSDGHRPVVLDALFLTNGRAVLEQAWRRSRARA